MEGVASFCVSNAAEPAGRFSACFLWPDGDVDWYAVVMEVMFPFTDPPR